MDAGQAAYIVSAIRTPVGKRGGVFAQERPDDMLAAVLGELLKKNPSLDPAAIEDVVVGCAMPEAEQGLNVGRLAALLAGYPDSAAGTTVNRLCASGLQSIAWAADRIRLGEAQVLVAGGVESMTMVPMAGNKPAMNPRLFSDDKIALGYSMGITAEIVAERFKISREQQDAYALNSHQLACKASSDGSFAAEIMPCQARQYRAGDDGSLQIEKQTIRKDEGPRADTSSAALTKLKPAFMKDGTVTAGNSSQMSDGAAALLLASERALKTFDMQPIARFMAYAVTGVAPEIMGIGPVQAIPMALKQCGIKQNALQWIELNEAFAAQTVAVIQELDLSRAIVNPLGGAIALGHPLGATGAIRTATLLHGMQKNKLHYGMTTMCVGGGMGAAGVFENVR